MLSAHLGAVEEVAHSQQGGQDAVEGGILHQLLHAHFQVKQWLCNFLVWETRDSDYVVIMLTCPHCLSHPMTQVPAPCCHNPA